jgi:hypothetical protein
MSFEPLPPPLVRSQKVDGQWTLHISTPEEWDTFGREIEEAGVRLRLITLLLRLGAQWR